MLLRKHRSNMAFYSYDSKTTLKDSNITQTNLKFHKTADLKVRMY